MVGIPCSGCCYNMVVALSNSVSSNFSNMLVHMFIWHDVGIQADVRLSQEKF